VRGRGVDAGAQWLRFLEGLEEVHRRLALSAVEPVDWRRLSARIQGGQGCLAIASQWVEAAPDPRRWGRALRAGRDAVEYLETLEAWARIPGAPGWPAALDAGADPVALLVGRGEIPPGLGLAVVGTRRSSPACDALARELAVSWVAQGGWVVSGGAQGIDAAAHRGALAAGGVTVAVGGTGLGHPFPPFHRGLFAEIERRGAVVSEYPPTFSGRPTTFLDRNRIIAGLAMAVVVVEAPPRSGALSTARFALKCGRKVLTVPGNPGLPRSEGARSLLSSGALPLRGPKDLPACPQASETRVGAVSQRRARVDAVGQRILAVLDTSGDGRHLDEIGRHTALPPGELSATLLELELEGLVDALDGGRFRRNPDEF
jgi:DNA processing protein